MKKTKQKDARKRVQRKDTTRPRTQLTVTLRLADDVAPVVDHIAALAQTDPAIVVNVLLAMLIVTRATDATDDAEPETPEPPPVPEEEPEEEANPDHDDDADVAGA